MYFTDELVDNITKETDNYANCKMREKRLKNRSIWNNWKNLEIGEFWAFLSVIFNMGTMPLKNEFEYWSTSNIGRIPFYSDKFTRDRLNQIFWMLKLKKIPPEYLYL